MWGAIIIVVALVIAMPVAIMMSGAAIAGVLGFLLKDDAERRGADTVWKDLNT
ncbi:MAG: hypothetical protein IT196_18800 [Acidimicrobiales bacterium]|nr:hypothetical protein [Acidimicrobiales bacterium]